MYSTVEPSVYISNDYIKMNGAVHSRGAVDACVHAGLFDACIHAGFFDACVHAGLLIL